MRLKQTLLPVLILFLLITPGCGGGTPTPAPSFIYTPSAITLYVIYGHSVNFTISPDQVDAANIYTWTLSGGTPTAGTGTNLVWNAPGYAAICTVTATVTKAGTQISTQSWTVNVRQSSTYTVTVTKSSVPIPGAEIEVLGTGYKGINDEYTGTTDNNGQVVLKVPYGTYTIRCKESGITTDRVDTIVAGSDSFTISL